MSDDAGSVDVGPAGAADGGDASAEQQESSALPQGEGADGGGDGGGAPSEPGAADILTLDSLGDLGDRKVRLTVDGEEVEVPLAEALKGHMRHRAFTRKTQAVAEERKRAQQLEAEVQQFVQALKQRPDAVLERLGIDVDALAERRLAQLLEWEKLPEHERARRQVETERQRLEREKREWEEQQQQERLTQEEQHWVAYFKAQVPQALEGAQLPLSDYNVQRVLYHRESALEAGFELSLEDAAQLVAEEQGQVRTSWLDELKSTPAEKLAELLGQDVVRQLSGHYAKGRPQPQPRQGNGQFAAGGAGQRSGDHPKPISMSEYRRLLDERRGAR